MSLLLLRPRQLDAVAPLAAPLDPAAAARIAAGRVGDRDALEGYVARARRLALAAGGAGCVATGLALGAHAAWGALALVLLLGAAFDRARGRLGATLRMEEDALVVDRGPWAGLRVRRGELEAVGFGAPGTAGRRAPETFWRGDFGVHGRSPLVCLRLNAASGRPRRLILPERGIAEANAAVGRLRHWWSPSGGEGPSDPP